MIFASQLTIPVNTTQDSEVSVAIKPTIGTIKNIKTFFPFGHAGLTHIRYTLNETQIHPVVNHTYLIGDDLLLDMDIGIKIDDNALQIKAKAWNEDSIYPHTIYFWIDIDTDVLTFTDFLDLVGEV